jgi:hypothetical protein
MPKKKAKKKFVQQKRVKKTEADHLRILIEASERAMDGRGGSIDDYFTNQAARLRKQLKQLEQK